MKWWPFKKKVVEEVVEERVEKEPETIIINSNDSGMRRAEIAMRHAGMVINQTMYNQLPWIAQVFDEYKKLDQAAARRKRKTAKDKGGE
jgi:hypothetical protein